MAYLIPERYKKMDKLHTFYYFLELSGTFAFAMSGATTARQRGLNLFEICAIAYTVSCSRHYPESFY